MSELTLSQTGESKRGDAVERRPLIVDSDVHPRVNLEPYLSERWRRHLSLVGFRYGLAAGVRSAHRPLGCRLDAIPPDGGMPGSDPDFAREQLLDAYGISAAILNPLDAGGGVNAPGDLGVAVSAATNDYVQECWLESDPRWYAAIHVPMHDPAAAVREITRCRERSDRYVHVLLNAMTERPLGNPAYWPIYEAAAEYDIPVAFHAGSTQAFRNTTAVGDHPSSYFEGRSGLGGPARSILASLVFEGVFERWPTLKVAMIELGWTWAAPLAWRLDASWRVMREEVPHLERTPSQYLRDRVWFSTQPAIETESPRQADQLYAQFDRAGFGDRLLFASDYPHWDMDSPFEALPPRLSLAAKADILGANAAALYGIDFGKRL